jgi:hypothetical protein
MPLGGSKVILAADCSTGTGKYLAGIDVSHSRNSSFMLSCVAKASTIFSSLGIHDLARWQFCSTTQSPLRVAVSISRSAIGPCPWPSEMACIRSSRPISVAKRMMVDIGSAPAERTKTSGVDACVSG